VSKMAIMVSVVAIVKGSNYKESCESLTMYCYKVAHNMLISILCSLYVIIRWRYKPLLAVKEKRRP
jgi:hypothetical protein